LEATASSMHVLSCRVLVRYFCSQTSDCKVTVTLVFGHNKFMFITGNSEATSEVSESFNKCMGIRCLINPSHFVTK
jgi:hypothetical protein